MAALNQAGVSWVAPLVRISAVLASLGALLGLITGVGRTVLAMGRGGDLPAAVARVDERHHVPYVAEVVLAAVVVLLVVLTDLRHAIGFSSFGVLVYYAIANLAAYTQAGEHRRWPRLLNVLGALGCVTLVVTLPLGAVVAGAGVLAMGVAARVALRRKARP